MWSGLKAGELEQVGSVQLCYFGTTRDMSLDSEVREWEIIDAEDLPLMPNTELSGNVGKSSFLCAHKKNHHLQINEV